MHKEILACERPVSAGGFQLLPVVRVSIVSLEIKGNITFHAVKQPQYIMASCDGKTLIFNMQGEQITPNRARSEHPELEAALADCCDFPLPYDC